MLTSCKRGVTSSSFRRAKDDLISGWEVRLGRVTWEVLWNGQRLHLHFPVPISKPKRVTSHRAVVKARSVVCL